MKKVPNMMSIDRLALLLIIISFPATTTRAQDAELPREVQMLNESYAREIARVLPPVQEKYIAALERLLETYTRSGALDDALRVKEQIEKARQWNSLPLEQFRNDNNIEMDREGFEKWLRTKSFSFRGVSAVTLEFDKDKVRWITGGQPQEYDFKLRGKRGVIVEGAQNFRLEFADDLTSGTFESNLGQYALTIVDRK